MNPMRHIFKTAFVLGAVLTSVSCEMEFDVKDIKGEDRLFVECVPSPLDDYFEIVVLGTRSINNPTLDSDLSRLNLQMTVDGKRQDLAVRTDGNRRIFTGSGTFVPGQNLVIEAYSPGYEEIHAETVVPEMVEDFKVWLEADDRGGYIVNVKYQDDALTEDMYGVMVTERCIEESADGGFVGIFQQETMKYIEPMTYNMDSSSGILMDFHADVDNLIMWNDSRSRDGDYQTFRIRMSRSYDFPASDSNYTGQPNMLKSQYKVHLLKLSPEFYRYYKGRQDEQNDFLGILGLSAATFTYTNVNGGLGVLGSMSHTESQWLSNL